MSTFSSNLAVRVATAAVVLPLLAAFLFLAPLWVGVAIMAAAALLGLGEMLVLLRAGGIPPFPAVGYLVTAAAFLEAAAPGSRPSPWPALVVLVLLAALFASRRGVEPGTRAHSAVARAAGTLLGAAWLGSLAGSIAALHVLPPAGSGAWRVVLLLTTVMVSDTAAYFTGHALGRHKLAPAISPGKTVEGALGGLLGGVLGALIVRPALPSLPLGHAVALGLAVAAAGIAGDLAESLLKRWAGVKDSGGLFPGHGGMLDRLDSLLFGGPVLYYYFLLSR